MTGVCDICGHRGSDVRPGLVVWRDLAQPYNAIDRCSDHDACRLRVEMAGDEWPIVEETPLTVPYDA